MMNELKASDVAEEAKAVEEVVEFLKIQENLVGLNTKSDLLVGSPGTGLAEQGEAGVLFIISGSDFVEIPKVV